MGVIISSAVLPTTLTLLWSRQNKWAAMLSPLLGLACSLIAWLVTTSKEFDGVLNTATLGANNPMLAGNVVALLSPCIFIPVLTFAFGADNYDWKTMAAIRKGDDHDMADSAGIDLEDIPGEANNTADEEVEEQRNLLCASKIAKTTCVVLTISLLILWPMPMYGSSYIFSKGFFTGWVVVGILWLFCSLFCVGLYPLFEGRHSMIHTVKSIYLDATGKQHPSKHHRNLTMMEGQTAEKDDRTQTRPESKQATSASDEKAEGVINVS